MGLGIPLPAAPRTRSIFDTYAEGATLGNELQRQALQNALLQTKNQYAPGMAEAGMQNALLKNRIMGTEAQYAPQMTEAKLQELLGSNSQIPIRNALLQAQTGYTGAQTNALNQKLPAEIENIKAQANQRNLSGGGLGVGGKEQMFFQNLVAKDNPKLADDPDKLYAAANAIAAGKNQLDDGTPLNISPAAKQSLDRITKYSSTSPLITQGIRQAQADAELTYLTKVTNDDLNVYGDTYAGYSIPQIIDTMKTDKESQTKLGKFIGAQALQYEASQIRNKIAGGEPSAFATQELMGRSGQIIKTQFPKLSALARETARNYMDEHLKGALKERQKLGISPSMLNRLGGEEGGSGGAEHDPLGIR